MSKAELNDERMTNKKINYIGVKINGQVKCSCVYPLFVHLSSHNIKLACCGCVSGYKSNFAVRLIQRQVTINIQHSWIYFARSIALCTL